MSGALPALAVKADTRTITDRVNVLIGNINSWANQGGVALQAANNNFVGVNTLNGGTDTVADANAAGQILSAWWPMGDMADADPSLQLGTFGFNGPNVYYQRTLSRWENRALTQVDWPWNSGALVNAASGFPGALLNDAPAFRFQLIDTSGDFFTAGMMANRTASATSYLFLCDTVKNNTKATNLKPNLASNQYIAKAVAAGVAITIRQHQGTQILPANAQVIGVTADTVTLNAPLTGTSTVLTNVLFSLVIIAPAANWDGTHPFLTYYYMPLILSGESGSAVLSSPLFDPKQIGVPPYTTITGTGLPSGGARLSDFTSNTAVATDATTGQPITTTSSGGGSVTFTADTQNEVFTFTGTLDGSGNIGSTSVDLTQRAISITGGAAYDKPQADGIKGVFTQGQAVSAIAGIGDVGGPSITFGSPGASQTLTQTPLKVCMRCDRIDFFATINGVQTRVFNAGMDSDLAASPGIACFRIRGFPVYVNVQEVFDASGNLVGPINSNQNGNTSKTLTITSHAAPSAPSASGAMLLYVDSADSKLKVIASSGTITTLASP